MSALLSLTLHVYPIILNWQFIRFQLLESVKSIFIELVPLSLTFISNLDYIVR